MTFPESSPGQPERPDEALPPVQAPTTESVIQQFLIPLVIVGFIFGVLFFLKWLFHVDNDPHALVRELRRMNSDSWRKAYALSNLLRSPENDDLKDDAKLCAELAAILEDQVAAGGNDVAQVRFRVFLCRAIGEFRVDDGLPALIHAIEKEGSAKQIDVRYAALEAIAVLADNMGPEKIRSDPKVAETLIKASSESGEQEPEGKKGELCSTAAYALGVVGGTEALDRLAFLTTDVRPNIRYNAATGLARNGDERAIPVLIEMLDPDNRAAATSETGESAKEAKIAMVLGTGIRATLKLCTNNPNARKPELMEALKKLNGTEGLPGRIRIDSKEALLRLEKN